MGSDKFLALSIGYKEQFSSTKALQTTNYMLAKLIIPMSILSWPTNNIHNLKA